jgi:hypothetical protein
MARFEGDWATAKIASNYAGHLRAKARSRHELEEDHRYDYLKANSAKRHKDAPRGVRPGLAKPQGRTDTSSDTGQDPGPSRAGPSSEPNINTTNDEDAMDAPGLYGSRNPSDREDESGLDDDPDFKGRD